MAITRYAGDRFTIAAGETKPTGVLDGAVLIDTGNLTQHVKRTVAGTSQWSQIAGGGGGGWRGWKRMCKVEMKAEAEVLGELGGIGGTSST